MQAQRISREILAGLTSTTSANATNERCPSCSKKMILDDKKKLYCWTCSVIAREDEQLANEVLKSDKLAKIRTSYNDFMDNSNINEKLKKATFDNYIPNNKKQHAAKETLVGFANDFKKGESKSFLVTGTYGIGKSHLAISVTKTLMKREYTAIFIQVNKLLTRIKSSWHKDSSESEGQILNALADADLLVIDDFGAEFTEKDRREATWKTSKINEIVDSRCGKSTIYTTNFSEEELSKMYIQREFGRMMEDADVIEIDGEDYRLRRFQK